MRQEENLAAARTVAVNTLVVGETTYLFNCRHTTASALVWEGITGNRYVLLAMAMLLAFQAMVTYLLIAQAPFGTAAIDASACGRIIAFGCALMLVVELKKGALRAMRDM